MRYVGGKYRLRKWVADAINEVRGDCTSYLEPFVGGGNTFEIIAPTFPTSACGDSHEDLILLWQAVAAGWQPPHEITREQWAALRVAPPSAERAFAGYGSSFRGKWFGGYEPSPRVGAGGKVRHAVREMRRALLRAVPAFAAADIQHRDFHEWRPGPGVVVYCDPPYRGTTGYGAVPAFDHDKFWAVAEQWARDGAVVVVSEQDAPPEWSVLRHTAQADALRYSAATPGRAARREALYVIDTEVRG